MAASQRHLGSCFKEQSLGCWTAGSSDKPWALGWGENEVLGKCALFKPETPLSPLAASPGSEPLMKPKPSL